MIQCCVCEDWYHADHLKLTDPVPAEYEDMICFGCVKRYKFLNSYSNLDDLTTSAGAIIIQITDLADPCPLIFIRPSYLNSAVVEKVSYYIHGP